MMVYGSKRYGPSTNSQGDAMAGKIQFLSLTSLTNLFTAGVLAAVLAAGTRANVEANMLDTGKTAPDFTLVSDKGDTGETERIPRKESCGPDFLSRRPDARLHQTALRDPRRLRGIREKGAVVFGVNPANAESHVRFVKKQGYQFPLLVDRDKNVAKQYGADGIMVQRTVYVVDREGKIVFARRGMPADAEILASIKAEPGK